MALATAVPVKTLSLTQAIQCPAKQVYQAITSQDHLIYWLCDEARLRAAEGGHVLLVWNQKHYHVTGSVLKAEENETLHYTWRESGEMVDSVVEISLKETDGKTTLSLIHNNLPQEADYDLYQREWSNRLRNLASYLETGADLRITERVILGIFPDAFDEDIAKKLGVPVTEGARVSGVIPNLGAAKIGLQPDDVITELNGKAINNQTPLTVPVHGKKPGEEVEIVFYRGAEKQTATLNLSGYPVPAMPTSYEELADHTQKKYDMLNAELTGLFEGISEEQASKKPAEGEWNAKEVVAHLILSEQWIHNWIGGLMQPPEVAGYTANSVARIAGVTSTFPTKEDILKEMRRSWNETAAIMRHIPAEFATRKSNLWWITFEIEGFEQHTRRHFDQIKEALTAATR